MSPRLLPPFAVVISCQVLAGGLLVLAEEQKLEFFETRIRPQLIEHCYECHSAATAEPKGGLRLDSRPGIRKGGESGAAVVPGAPSESLLLAAIRHESFEMPPDKKLPDAVIRDFEAWIAQGALDPRDKPPTSAEAGEIAWSVTFQKRKDWWSYRAVKDIEPPEVDSPWVRRPIDKFILRELGRRSLQPAPDADAATILRRISFLLTGLPPAADRIQPFLRAFDRNPDAAVAQLTDSLLASPHYGERMARRWMDVVRYTDTYGYEWDNPARGSWEYRDYLIRAYNHDIGFDQLLREQVAGDLLDPPRIDEATQVNESLIGPMFYHLGEHRHGDSLDFNGIHQEMVNNKIEAFSKAFLATTVACARCHDHKLDPVSQKDYYALSGVVTTPRWTARQITTPKRYASNIARLRKLRGEIRDQLKHVWLGEAKQFEQNILAALRDENPEADPIVRWRKAILAPRAEDAKAMPSADIADIAHPLHRLSQIAQELSSEKAQMGSLNETWEQLRKTWKTTRAARRESNDKSFRVIADFRTPELPKGWVAEGDGVREGYVEDGAPRVSLEGDRVVAEMLPRGYHTHALSSKLPGSLRLPDQSEWPAQSMSVLLAGGHWSGFLRIPENAFQTEQVTFLNRPQAAWQRFAPAGLKNTVQRVRVEIATADLNPNFPPRTGKAVAPGLKLPDNDEGRAKRSHFSVTRVVAHDGGAAPADELAEFEDLYSQQEPANPEQLAKVLAHWFQRSISRWSNGQTQARDVKVLNWLLAHELLQNSRDRNTQLRQLTRQYREAEASIEFPRSVVSMDERDTSAFNYPLNVRGNVDVVADAPPRDFLQLFASDNQVAQSAGSGRLELADYLASRRNPLTARVYVNRVWHWIFGRGLVATPNDFGRLGASPSHPELLDYLAMEFTRDGWSTKRLIRRLMLSRVFRQSGHVTPESKQADPDNVWLSRYPTRRLEAEAIRDSILAVSGSWDRTLYGPPIRPPRGKEDPAKRLFSGPLDGVGRRSLYIQMSIMDPPKFLVGFNLPDLKLPTGARDVANTPAQALILLNDPFVHQQADRWGGRLVRQRHASPEVRMEHMFETALGRSPTVAERARWLEFAKSCGNNSEPGALLADQAAWAQVAHAIFNTKEFIYYR